MEQKSLRDARHSFRDDQSDPHILNRNGFHIHRGTNVSHLFIDERLPYGDLESYFDKRDLRSIKSFGFDHIRLPICETRFWNADGTRIEASFEQLDRVLGDSIKGGLRVILCVQELRSHYKPGVRMKAQPLFGCATEVDKFKNFWTELSAQCSKYPGEKLAYELLNEPFAPTDEAWNEVLGAIYDHVRKLEPERTLVVGPNFFQYPEKMRRLRINTKDPNLIRSFHFYHPHLVTHHQIPWGELSKYDGPVNYSGHAVPKSHIGELNRLGHHSQRENMLMTKAVMKVIMKRAIGEGPMANVPIHCGEFGCYKGLPEEMSFRWHQDVVEALDELGIAWSHWDWKGNFGLLDQYSWRPREIHKALGLRTPLLHYPRKLEHRLGATLRRKVRTSLKGFRARRGRD